MRALSPFATPCLPLRTPATPHKACCRAASNQHDMHESPWHLSHWLAAAVTAIGPLLVTPTPAIAEQLSLCQQAAQPTTQLQLRGARLKLGKEQIYYPDWLFGEWRVMASQKGADATLSGSESTPPLATVSLQQGTEGADDGAVHFRWRFYSTLPDTFSNSFRMNVGQVPEDAIVADRAFNIAELIKMHRRHGKVLESSYDPRDSPDRQRLVLAAQDGGGQQVLDLSLTSLQGAADEADANRFCTIEEYSQQVSGSSSIEYEVVSSYHRLAPDHVVVQQGEVYFQQPKVLLSGFGAKQPAAAYLYELDLRRETPPPDARGAAACVETPKGFTQCV